MLEEQGSLGWSKGAEKTKPGVSGTQERRGRECYYRPSAEHSEELSPRNRGTRGRRHQNDHLTVHVPREGKNESSPGKAHHLELAEFLKHRFPPYIIF